MTEWLTKHKVWFEIAAYTLVPIIGFFIALQANKIASTQSQIAEEQAVIMRQQQLPILTLKSSLSYDQDSGSYTNDTLTITNEGISLRDLHVYAAVFYLIEYGQESQGVQHALVPIADYYAFSIPTGDSTGLLITMSTPYNNLMTVNSTNEFTAYAKEHNAFGSLYIRRYVAVSYTDIFGDNHSEIYYVDPVAGGILLKPSITKVAAEQAVKMHQDYLNTHIEHIGVESATSETFLGALNSFGSVASDYPLLHFLWE